MNYKISSFHPEWYAGNIYDLERTLPQIVPLSITNSTPGPIQFDLFVSGDYEVGSGFPFELLYRLIPSIRSDSSVTHTPKTLRCLLRLSMSTWR